MLRAAVDQLEAYFDKKLTSFDLDLDFAGATTGFQRDVYDRLMAIEYGHVASYGQVARDIGKPDMARTVGQAVGANPLPIVIPCHRVVAASGQLGGFSAPQGTQLKKRLLELEAARAR